MSNKLSFAVQTMGVTEFKLLSLVVVEKWRNSISAVLKLYLYKTNSHSKQVQTQERAVPDFCSCRNTITTTKPTIVGNKRTRNKPELLGEMKEEEKLANYHRMRVSNLYYFVGEYCCIN